MKAVRILRDHSAAGLLEGRVICHDVRDAQGKVVVEKGQVLDAGAVPRLLTLPWRELHLLELEPGDIHEEPAGARLSQASAREGVEVRFHEYDYPVYPQRFGEFVPFLSYLDMLFNAGLDRHQVEAGGKVCKQLDGVGSMEFTAERTST